jgi:aminocarboxymuconate-semialdehyde decarboxylase
VTAVDVHAHHMGTDLADMPGSAPRLVVDRADAGRIMCGDTTFRKVSSVLWSVSDRLAEMDRAAVSHQVISPVPVTMEFAAEPGADPAYARAVNDSIVAACAASGGRLIGLGCLPFGTPDAVVAELERSVEQGLRGIEIGTRIGELDPCSRATLSRTWGWKRRQRQPADPARPDHPGIAAGAAELRCRWQLVRQRIRSTKSHGRHDRV